MGEAQIYDSLDRKKFGRKAFESADHLYRRALEYFQWCDTHPMYRTEQLKKPGPPLKMPDGSTVPGETLVEIPLKRPYTMGGLCIYLGVHSSYFRNFESKRREGRAPTAKYIPIGGDDEEFLEVIDFIKESVYTQQYEGAVAGQFQANIVARGIGLADKTEIDQRTTEVKEVFKIGDKFLEF